MTLSQWPSLKRSSSSRAPRDDRDRGQAVLAMVLALALMMVTAGGALAVNAMSHDPLVQTDSAEHYAYRALEAGINGYLSTVNAHPELVDCSSTSTASTCTSTNGGIQYDTWTQIPQTTTSAGNVPEYYLWTNPQLCFSTTKSTKTDCTATPTASDGNFEYLKVKIIGAAGYPGHFVYQSSVVYLSAANGFLTRVWWSNYESTDENVSDPTTHCKYNWTKKTTSSYQGKKTAYIGSDGFVYTEEDGGDGRTCTEIVFAHGTVVDGPVFSNDSIFVTAGNGGPTFGTTTSDIKSPVVTADPKCLFVLGGSAHDSNDTVDCKTVANTDVKLYTTEGNSRFGAAKEPIPTGDTTLLPLAKLDGCVYLGPTTISLYAVGKKQYMNVSSPETPVGATGVRDEEDDTGNAFNTVHRHKCTGVAIPAPTSANTGNGVIYVATSTVGTDGIGTCTGNGDNPFDGKLQDKAAPSDPTAIEAQVVAPDKFPGTTSGYVYPDGETAGSDDCAGDVFVRDTDTSTTHTGGTPGIAGNLTIAAENNVVITGDLKYTDCGSAFESTYKYSKTCKYTPKTVNDSLGLIATNFVEVNRPRNPGCEKPTSHKSTIKCYPNLPETHGTEPTPGIATSCTSTVSDLTAVLCTPKPSGSTLVIDAAVLALKHSFAVNDYTVGGPSGTLDIYGSVDQDWRGAVGLAGGGEGYVKHYVWDSRLQYVTIPHYLTPATASWELVSSSVQLSTSCSGWPKPYPTGSTTTTPTHDPTTFPAATTKGPTGASGACSSDNSS